MASCTGSGASSPGVLDPDNIDRLAHELYKCVKKDQLVKAKFNLKGLRKKDKKLIASKTFDGNAPLFLAAQHGQVHFVNYLLDECGADIEQKGVYEVAEDRSRHQVTPLWCASVANKLEIIKSLIKHAANVNATSDTQSTPVRSACYMTNIEVVKYLVENGADIHKPNMNGGTCLINSVQSVELCKFLIEKGASVNAQDNSGNLALHYAIREGRVDTVRLLLKNSSDPYVRNDFGDDAVQTASLRGYSEILEYLFYRIKPSFARQIEAYELMATNFVDEKHDIQRAIQTWRTAMEMRFKDPHHAIRKVLTATPTQAYQYAVECTDMDELEEMIANPDAIYMQALLIRERILGPDHKDTIFGLMYRGAVYADTHRYQRCVDLWKYAFQLRHEKREPLNHECLFTLQALCKLFWEIFEEHQGGFTNETAQYNDVIEVFCMAAREVEEAKDIIHIRPVHQLQQEEFQTMLELLLHLIHLLCKLPKDEKQTFQFMRDVHRLMKMDIRSPDGRTLLHVGLDKKTSSVSEEFYSQFPSLEVINVLLECGTKINTSDFEGNTPLHVAGESMLAQQDDRLGQEMVSIINKLLSEGAHIDARNSQGQIAGTNLSNVWFKLKILDHVTLKCLAARVIKENNIQFEGEVPTSLIPFIEMH